MLDETDIRITHAIRVSPRVSFAQVADTLGVPEQTVTRRYRRLRREGLLRVTVAVNPHAFGETAWQVRVQCRPEGASAIADALARRDDVSWITILSAGWEVTFNLNATSSTDSEELLTRLLPKAAPVQGVSPAAIIHTYAGGAPDDWQPWSGLLSAEQIRELAATRIADPGIAPHPGSGTALTAEDRRIIDHLHRDGRIPYATVARSVGTTAGKVTRRIDQLLRSGVIYLDVDLAYAATEMQPTALWLTVEPRHLRSVGEALAAHPNVPFAAATTGPTNLATVVMTTGPAGLYDFVTGTMGSVDGITGYEIAIIDRRIKHATALNTGGRLAPPTLR
ncbi:AsnC family transcriptional regulator [Gordonia sp. CPCC 206044]|uniref:AsnC family transcriptional regulator n=1 Tax=Gordonia sp. CPCC 206044 TaxID=3140793 RepID=UPI003AF40A2C